MTEYTVKFKRVDTGKYWIAGNVKQGKYGLQAGMKKTPEFAAYLNSVPDGGWINLSLDVPYEKPQGAVERMKDEPAPLDDHINF